MKHPSHEQWMDYLYGELPAEQQAELNRHLETCAECQAGIHAWRAAMQGLDAWKLPAIPPLPQANPRPRYWQWAAAAVVLLGFGFGLGRWAAPSPDLAALRGQLEPQMRQQIKKEMAALAASHQADTRQALAALADALESQRLADRQATLKLLKEQDAQQTAEWAALRRDLETVAVLTDGSLRNTQDQIGRLAALNLNQ
jgi:hypothetical protein